MKITGIITEYNPFHNGHLYHLEKAKNLTKADGIICIMSGNFVQRGGPALIDKWQRTNMALQNGVDLVIELPTVFAVSSADFFAKGAVSILNSLGVVNNIVFGSECGEINKLMHISRILANEPEKYKILLKENLRTGLTYAKARENALSQYINSDSKNISQILSSSNNILGIEYIKALINLNSKITPLPITREGSNYNDINLSPTFSSATSIRKYLKDFNSLSELKNTIPEPSFKILKDLNDTNYSFTFEEDMFQFIKYRILLNCVNFNNLFEITEGLDNKIIKEIHNSNSYNQFILNIKSKRYTYSKISRLLTYIYLGFDKYEINPKNFENLLYARVLGFNETGKKMLSLIKNTSNIPLITKVPKYFDNNLLKLDIQATKAYSNLNSSID